MEEERKPEEQPAEPEQPIQPPTPQPVPPPSDTNTLIILGWVFVGLSVLGYCCCCPLFFGPVAAILGGIAYSRGDQRGLWILIAAIIIFILTVGLVVLGDVYHWPSPLDRFPDIPGPWRRA